MRSVGSRSRATGWRRRRRFGGSSWGVGATVEQELDPTALHPEDRINSTEFLRKKWRKLMDSSMDTHGRARTLLTVLCFAVALFACGIPAWGEEPLVIVVGSSHVGDVVKALSGDAPFAVQTLVPPTMCPGHFDAKPSEIAAVKKARCVLLHDWQQSMPGIRSVLAAAQIPADKVSTIAVPGNWLVPTVQEQAVDRVASVLAGVDPVRAGAYQAKATERIEAVRRAGESVLRQFKDGGCGAMNIICHDKLADFLKWAGFAVVLEYGQDGQLSARRMSELVREGRAARVKLVVDNVQGGGLRTGAAIARDTGAAHVILSNFPGGFSGVDTWEDTLRKNADILVRAAKEVGQSGA